MGGSKPEDQITLAKKLIVRRAVFIKAWPEEVFDYLRQKSRELDPAHKGVNIIVELRASDVIPKPEKSNQPTIPSLEPVVLPIPSGPIILTFEDTSIFELTQTVAEHLGLHFTARPEAIYVHPKGKAPRTKLQ